MGDTFTLYNLHYKIHFRIFREFCIPLNVNRPVLQYFAYKVFEKLMNNMAGSFTKHFPLLVRSTTVKANHRNNLPVIIHCSKTHYTELHVLHVPCTAGVLTLLQPKTAVIYL